MSKESLIISPDDVVFEENQQYKNFISKMKSGEELILNPNLIKEPNLRYYCRSLGSKNGSVFSISNKEGLVSGEKKKLLIIKRLA